MYFTQNKKNIIIHIYSVFVKLWHAMNFPIFGHMSECDCIYLLKLLNQFATKTG